MRKFFRWIGLIVLTPFILFLGLYIFTIIVQLWPEPIDTTFKLACDYDLGLNFEIYDRRHSYSNWMHGVWYTDDGKVALDKSYAREILVNLQSNVHYVAKGHNFEKFIVGKQLSTCSVEVETGVVEYGLVLW